MHPIVAHPQRLRIFGLVWPFLGAATGVLPYLWADGDLQGAWKAALWGQMLVVPALASWYACRSAPLATAGPLRIFATVGAGAALIAGLWVEAGRAVFPEPFLDLMRGPALTGAAALFVLMAAVHYALAASDQGIRAAHQLLEGQVATRDAQLRALRAQVNPHFLFNCLHSVSALTSADPEAARRMCLELAGFFRDSLRASGLDRIPLAEEAALVRQYLDIERVRFGHRLRVTVDVPPDAAPALVPPLILQPLAENAVRHGIAALIDGGDVSIGATRKGDQVEILVTNPYDPEERRPGSGVGLANVRARLETTYPGTATLSVRPEANRFQVRITLPMEASS